MDWSRATGTYWVVIDEEFEVLNRCQAVSLEYSRVGKRVWNQILSGEQPNLRVLMADEADKLAWSLAVCTGICARTCLPLRVLSASCRILVKKVFSNVQSRPETCWLV